MAVAASGVATSATAGRTEHQLLTKPGGVLIPSSEAGVQAVAFGCVSDGMPLQQMAIATAKTAAKGDGLPAQAYTAAETQDQAHQGEDDDMRGARVGGAMGYIMDLFSMLWTGGNTEGMPSPPPCPLPLLPLGDVGENTFQDLNAYHQHRNGGMRGVGVQHLHLQADGVPDPSACKKCRRSACGFLEGVSRR